MRIKNGKTVIEMLDHCDGTVEIRKLISTTDYERKCCGHSLPPRTACPICGRPPWDVKRGRKIKGQRSVIDKKFLSKDAAIDFMLRLSGVVKK